MQLAGKRGQVAWKTNSEHGQWGCSFTPFRLRGHEVLEPRPQCPYPIHLSSKKIWGWWKG